LRVRRKRQALILVARILRLQSPKQTGPVCRAEQEFRLILGTPKQLNLRLNSRAICRVELNLTGGLSSLRVCRKRQTLILVAQILRLQSPKQTGPVHRRSRLLWAMQGSNLRPFGCDPNALPAELIARNRFAKPSAELPRVQHSTFFVSAGCSRVARQPSRRSAREEMSRTPVVMAPRTFARTFRIGALVRRQSRSLVSVDDSSRNCGCLGKAGLCT
jgi:hypothetical protein